MRIDSIIAFIAIIVAFGFLGVVLKRAAMQPPDACDPPRRG
jgi:hypothetical protein